MVQLFQKQNRFLLQEQNMNDTSLSDDTYSVMHNTFIAVIVFSDSIAFKAKVKKTNHCSACQRFLACQLFLIQVFSGGRKNTVIYRHNPKTKNLGIKALSLALSEYYWTIN